MSAEVGNSLLVKTILSPVCDVGRVNQQTLVRRIKKLDQSERLALREELTFLSQRMRAPEKIRDIDLKEKGLCTLLLADDGMPAKTDGYFVSFFRGLGRKIANLFFGRVSSQSLVSQVVQVRRELVSRQTLAVSNDPVMPDPVCSGLSGEILRLQQLQGTLGVAEKFKHVSGQLKQLHDLFARLSPNPTLGESTAIIVKSRLIREYVAKELTVPNTVREQLMRGLGDFENLITTLNASPTMREFVASNAFKDAHPTKEVAQFATAIESGTESASDEKIKKELVRDVIVPSACTLMRMGIAHFQRETEAESSLKVETEKNVGDLQRRLLFMSDRVQLTDARKDVKEAEATCKMWEKVHDALDVLSQPGAFDGFKASALALHSLVAMAPGREVYNTAISENPVNTFGECLSFIADILNGNAATREQLAHSIQLELYQIPQDQEPGTTLYPFVATPGASPPHGLAMAYTQYLQKVVAKKLEVATGALQEKRTIVQQQEQELLSRAQGSVKEAHAVLQPKTPTPGSSARVCAIPEHAPAQTYNETGQDQRETLIPIARGIKADAPEGSLKGHPLEQTVLNNFYFIALGNHAVGKDDPNWGGVVFHAEAEMNSLVQNASAEDLKYYRMMALLYAINGLTLTQGFKLPGSG